MRQAIRAICVKISPRSHERGYGFDIPPRALHARSVRALFFLLVLTLSAAAQIHPSLPEPGTLDGLGVNIHFTQPLPGDLCH